MTAGSRPITVDYDALDRHARAIEGIADRLDSAIEAGQSTGGLDAAHAFGLMCMGMNVPATLVSSTVTAAMGTTKVHLRSIAERVRAGVEDFRELESEVERVSRTGTDLIDDVPGMRA